MKKYAVDVIGIMRVATKLKLKAERMLNERFKR